MIGPIIKEKRISQGLTQKELADGICTDKYIYLIETKQRNPSVKMLNKISNKLNIDLFEYYQYLHFDNPAVVMEYKKKFEYHIQMSEVEKLKEVADQAAQLDVFQSEPLIYDIKVINLFYLGIIKGNKEEAIKKLTNILQNKELEIDSLTLIRGYVALASIYQIDNQLDNAKKTISLAHQLIESKTEYSRYNVTYINVLISLTSLLFQENNYDELINYSKQLLTFQKKHNEYNRIYYAEFYLASGYFRNNRLAKSKKHFIRSLQLMSLFKNKRDNNLIQNMDIFSEMIDYFSINEDNCFYFENE